MSAPPCPPPPPPAGPNADLAFIVDAHVASFDYFVLRGMQAALSAIAPVEVTLAQTQFKRTRHSFSLCKPVLEAPRDLGRADRARKISRDAEPCLPSDCRQSSTTYRGNLMATLVHVVTEEVADGEGAPWQEASTSSKTIKAKLGMMPVMVQSAACHLRGVPQRLSGKELLRSTSQPNGSNKKLRDLPACGEENNEMGGYFILNGIERIVRLLILNRRHYAMALRRSAYRKRGPSYTDMATMIRCVRPDQSGVTVRLHYLSDGRAMFGFSIRRREYFVPLGVMLKALLACDYGDARLNVGVSDRELFDSLVGSCFAESAGDAAFVAERAEAALRDCADRGLRAPLDCLRYLGRHFLPVLATDDNNEIANVDRNEELAMHRAQPATLHEQASLEQTAGLALLKKYVFVHLNRGEDKFQLLVHMAQKLFALASGTCKEDNADALCHHEVLMPGHLLTIFYKERCAEWLGAWKRHVESQLKPKQQSTAAGGQSREKRVTQNKLDLNDESSIRRAMGYMKDIGRAFDYFLATGNLVSTSGLDLPQATGYTVVADKLNYLRFMSHFRSVHRGAYFAELRTTTVRKLLPESWGFLCPVHTPDGSPCGLLLHLTRACYLVCDGGKPSALQRMQFQQNGKTRSAMQLGSDAGGDDDEMAGPFGPNLADNAKENIWGNLMRVLYECGMSPIESSQRGTLSMMASAAQHLRVVVDGRVVGTIPAGEVAMRCEATLRALKAAAYAFEVFQELWAPKVSADGASDDEGMDDAEAERERRQQEYTAQISDFVSSSKKYRRGAQSIHANRFQAALAALPSWAVTDQGGSLGMRHTHIVPSHMEVVHLGVQRGDPYPTLTLFTEDARFVRPVLQVPASYASSGSCPPPEHLPVELVGSLESTHLTIACPHATGASDAGGVDVNRAVAGNACAAKVQRWLPERGSTHREIDAMSPLSFIASLTPWSDRNQSPRNMYQCQMAKQTMGYPCDTLRYRNDTKMYKIHYPQTPVCRNESPYKQMSVDEYPLGFNAVVAVISYTGFDMEDAMILNKGSVDRGLAHGTLHKSEVVDLGLVKDTMRSRRGTSTFGTGTHTTAASSRALDLQAAKQKRERRGRAVDASDGLPSPGTMLHGGESLYCEEYRATGAAPTAHAVKGADPCVIDSVALIGSEQDGAFGPRRASIRMRYDRNPVIGDKFSSRHGQKGTLSKQWPEEDMPFSESTGMRPDLIINPHAFPSRMTIGMLIESMAGKAGAMDGKFYDSTPFAACDVADGIRQSDEEGEDALSYRDPADIAADKLASLGFARGGKETFISGHNGAVLEADIFVGIVYYQRLRHMVSDKYQVRSVGAVNPLTRQPIKGRKVGGGIRFGEMERDALLSHGCAYLLHDRLHTSSDYHVAEVCSLCGGLLGTHAVRPTSVAGAAAAGAALGGAASVASLVVASADAAAGQRALTCRTCSTGRGVVRVAMPYVFRYLAAELAAMNIKLTLVVGGNGDGDDDDE